MARDHAGPRYRPLETSYRYRKRKTECAKQDTRGTHRDIASAACGAQSVSPAAPRSARVSATHSRLALRCFYSLLRVYICKDSNEKASAVRSAGERRPFLGFADPP